MASQPHPYHNSPRLIGSVSNSKRQSIKGYNRGPFGPGMAEDIFGVYDEAEAYPYETHDEYEEIPTSGEEYWYQTSLPLKSVAELEEELRNEIRKWDRAYHRVMIYALKWFYLMEEVEENPQIKKMFQDMQMVRKLGGSDRV